MMRNLPIKIMFLKEIMREILNNSQKNLMTFLEIMEAKLITINKRQKVYLFFYIYLGKKNNNQVKNGKSFHLRKAENLDNSESANKNYNRKRYSTENNFNNKPSVSPSNLSRIDTKINNHTDAYSINRIKKNKDIHKDGSVSENERDIRSNNFRKLNKNLSPQKREENHSQDPSYSNDYLKLESQIREVETHIKSMGTDYNLAKFHSNNYTYNHDEFLNRTNPSIKTVNTTNNHNYSYVLSRNKDVLNEIPTKFIGENNNLNANKQINQHVLERNINHNTIHQVNEIRRNDFTLDNNIHKRECNTINHTISHVNTNSNENFTPIKKIEDNSKIYIDKQIQNQMNTINSNNNKENLLKENYNFNKIQEDKINHIELKVNNMEKDIGEIKDNFNKLYDSMLKLIDFATGKFSNSNNNILTTSHQIPHQKFNDPSNLCTNRDYYNNHNEINNSQRINTQNSEKNNMNMNPNLQASQTMKSNNNITMNNSSNDVLNFILSECGKLKNQNFNNYNYNNPQENNNNNYNYNNFNQNDHHNNEVNYFESPRHYNKEDLYINLPYTNNPNTSFNKFSEKKKQRNLNDRSLNNEEDEMQQFSNFENSKKIIL